jgi:hypothetical protein
MIDAIVFTVAAGTVAFTIAWLVRPDLREWIERPKYRFRENVRRYDEETR